MALDSSYPSGGYGAAQGLSLARLGFKSGLLYGARVLSYNAATSVLADLQWDYANNKLMAFQSIPSAPFIVEEVVTITANAGRLPRVPGYITSIQSVGGTAGACRVIPVGTTPATLQVAVNFVTGAVATFATDAVTSLLVTYIPLGVGQFTAANRIVDEAFTFTTGGSNLANRAACIQYVWNTTSSTHLPKTLVQGQTPGSNEIAIAVNNSGATTITPNAAQNTNVGKVTYFKYGTPWISDHAWTDNAAVTITSTTLFAIADDLPVPPQGIYIPGYGNVLVGATAGAANLQAVIQGPQGTAGANVVLYHPILGKFVPTGADAYVTVTQPSLFVNGAMSIGAMGQCQTGKNLAAVTAEIEFIGL